MHILAISAYSLSFEDKKTAKRDLLVTPFLRWLRRRSYSIYMVHALVLLPVKVIAIRVSDE